MRTVSGWLTLYSCDNSKIFMFEIASSKCLVMCLGLLQHTDSREGSDQSGKGQIQPTSRRVTYLKSHQI
jgi:hypothetical protein